jgi:hypothetical protein
VGGCSGRIRKRGEIFTTRKRNSEEIAFYTTEFYITPIFYFIFNLLIVLFLIALGLIFTIRSGNETHCSTIEETARTTQF